MRAKYISLITILAQRHGLIQEYVSIVKMDVSLIESNKSLTYSLIHFFVVGAAEQFQRATTISAPRPEMTPQNTLSNTFNNSIHQLKREVDSYKQRQQEIVSFDQVCYGQFSSVPIHKPPFLALNAFSNLLGTGFCCTAKSTSNWFTDGSILI